LAPRRKKTDVKRNLWTTGGWKKAGCAIGRQKRAQVPEIVVTADD